MSADRLPSLVLAIMTATEERVPVAEKEELPHWVSRIVGIVRRFARPMAPRHRLVASARVAIVLGIVILWATIAPAARAQTAEYEQKASLICGLLRNVEWPTRKMKSPSAPFVIGIVGQDMVSDFLREDLQGRRIKDRPVQIRVLTSLQEVSSCHLLFVSQSENDRLRSILSEARREGILTVGEADNFLSSGGVVQFVFEGTRVTYRVSQGNASREALKLNGFVLRFSKPQAYAHPRDEGDGDQRIARTPRE